MTGSYGGDRHLVLVKAALIKVVDRYYERHGRIQVENKSLELSAFLGSRHRPLAQRDSAKKTLYPDIVMELLETRDEELVSGEREGRTIVVECETRHDGLLRDDMRLVAYDMLRIANPDRDKLKLYVAFPEELRGEVEKPECFNDVWFFDVKEGDA